jgi:hypothetical protein
VEGHEHDFAEEGNLGKEEFGCALDPISNILSGGVQGTNIVVAVHTETFNLLDHPSIAIVHISATAGLGDFAAHVLEEVGGKTFAWDRHDGRGGLEYVGAGIC